MESCLNCGEALGPRARFCPSCGTPAPSEETLVSGEETRLAAPRPSIAQPHAAQPQRVRPLSELAPREARPPAPHAAGDDEQIVFTVRPTLLFVKLGYVAAALCGVILIALLAMANAPLYVSIPLALALLLVPAYRHLKRNMLRYTLTDSKIEIEEGFFSQTTRNLPLRNIQDVTVRSTIFQRLLRFGNVVVDNAGGEGGTTILRNIPEPRRHAEMLLRQLRRWR
jgi:membrane protein YdbS with pleckstrin-like domain